MSTIHQLPQPSRVPPPGNAATAERDGYASLTPQQWAHIAHTNGWQHFGPVCPDCRGAR